MPYELIRVTSPVDWESYHQIRRAVLFQARGLENYDPGHPDEAKPHHHTLLLKYQGRAIATTRLDEWGDGSAVVRLVAVATALQRQGHGRVLSAGVERYALSLDVTILLVQSAPDAVGFYQRLGWRPYVWAPAASADIPLQLRKLLITPGRGTTDLGS